MKSALFFALGILSVLPAAANGHVFRSHPPMRPLPQPSDRPLADAPARHVDPVKGTDAGDGSAARPWKTLQHAVEHLAPGDTLYLRGGTYYEHVYLTESGEPGRPITIRSYPNELAVLDGGFREFFEDPARAWEPLVGGAAGEFISTRTYPDLDNRRIETSHLDYGHEPFHVHERARPLAMGFFGDSMVPLNGYRYLVDLRAPVEGIWSPERKADPDEKLGVVGPGVYVGPGLWYDRKTGRIHCRLAHGRVPGITNYAGETDPRKIPLLVAGGYGEDVLRIKGIKHVRIQDLIIRGVAGSALINIYGSRQLEFDGLTVYGGAPALLVKSTMDFRVVNCAFRSTAAPWSSRASQKYFGTAGYVIVTHQTNPESANWEMAYNEFTDGHDFFWMRFVRNLRFHHNLVDNFNDDVFEPGPKKRDHEIYIHENLISRANLTLSAHGIKEDESPLDAGPRGVFIFRNVFDLRQGPLEAPPRGDRPAAFAQARFGSDHGSPVWPQYIIYHNTVIRHDPSGKELHDYGFGVGNKKVAGTRRRVFNNIFVQLERSPARKGQPFLSLFPEGLVERLREDPAAADLQIDGNLFWYPEVPLPEGEAFFAQFRQSALHEASKRHYPPGWMAHDRFADPMFTLAPAGRRGPVDLSLREGSPAVDAGVAIPAEWPDPFREHDKGRPDIGAMPRGIAPWNIGVHRRLLVCPESGAVKS